MTDQTQRISLRGLGFFTSSGVLKTKDQLQGEAPGRSASAAGDSVTFTSQLNDALNGAESRFIERANASISLINNRSADLQDASDVVARQLAAAKSLKSALKSGDAEEAAKQKQILSDLQSERATIARQVDVHNREAAASKTQILSLDGVDSGKAVSVPEVSFQTGAAIPPAGFSTADAVTPFIDSLKADKETLKAQTRELHDVQQLVQDAIQAARDELSAIREDSLSHFDDASNLANAIAGTIRQGGVSVLESTIKKNINSDVISKLLN